MPDQILIGNFAKGLRTDRPPFNIENDAFPTLFNFYIWRGQAKRKRGTSLLARLQRQIKSTDIPVLPLVLLPWQFAPLAKVGPTFNLIAGPWTQGALLTSVTLEPNGSVTPGTVNVTVDGNTYTDPGKDGVLIGGTALSFINYVNGQITIPGSAGPLTGFFSYFPDLPVLGLEDFVPNTANANFPILEAFDPKYSYQVNQTTAIDFFYSTSYYKGSNAPVVWSNTDDNQFWSTNYQSAFWVTNNKPGLHYVNGTAAPQASATIVFNFTSNAAPFLNLVVGDVLWFNEWPAAPTTTINGINGTVTTVTGGGTYTVTFPIAVTVTGAGIAQLLTNSITGQDGIRWYDGDPTGGTGLPPNVSTGLGWVNFAPPLTALTVGINDQTPALYYLVGALAILPFKDRLLFFGPQIQAVGGLVIQKPIQDTVLWSWNGTPYYNPLVPTNPTNSETFDVRAYYVDQTGFGGYLPAGVSQPIMTVNNNEDVILIGFGGAGKKTRFVYTGDDLQPFLFYLINSELPSSSTFSGVVIDKGGIELGSYGITLTTQQSCERIDLDIPDEVFQIQALNNGQNRVNAIRDFFREWIYFSFPTGTGTETNGSWKYPIRTLMWNYRDDTWAIFRENFTHHGTYRKIKKNTWATIGAKFKTWANWREPWKSGSSSPLFPSIIAGNPQGYVLILDQGTGEGESGYIQAIANDGGGFTQITSFNHCVNSQPAVIGVNGDYLSFQGTTIGLVTKTIDANNFVVDIPFSLTASITAATKATQAVLTVTFPVLADPPSVNSFFVGQTITIAGVVGMTGLNGIPLTIMAVTPTTITVNVNSTGFGTYISGGTITITGYIGIGSYTRLSQPLIQTKQFQPYWQEGRQVRLSNQKYLLNKTTASQVTLNISLSQDIQTVYNDGSIVPSNVDLENSALIYSNVLYTCPESTNLGLTPANTNLQMPTASTQEQIWHRMNTSLIGDTIQVGITLNDLQMRNLTYATSEITLHGIQMNIDRGPQLS